MRLTANARATALLALAAPLVLAAKAQAQVFDSAASATTGASTSSSLSWTHTTSFVSPHRLLVVGISVQGSSSPLSVTYNGVVLTFLGGVTTPLNQVRVEMWALINPATGANNVVVTFGSPQKIVGGSASFRGFADNVSTLVPAISGGTSTTPSVTVQSAPGAIVLDTVAVRGDGTSMEPSQPQHWNLATSVGPPAEDVIGGGSTKAGAASVTTQWNLASNSFFAIAGLSIPNPAVPRTFTAAALAVDGESATGTLSNANGVLEPGETVLAKPSWRNSSASPVPPFTGNGLSPSGPGSATYTLPDSLASYDGLPTSGVGDCGTDCYQFSLSNPATRPVPHWDANFDEILSIFTVKTWVLHVGASFTDVPTSHLFYRFVETIFHKAVTAGTGPGLFSPDAGTTRQQMAVFLLVSKEGPGYLPPACTTPIFADVPCSSPFARWINELSNRGVTAGCGGSDYCPTDNVTRQQMSVFLLKAEEGPAYTPPPCTTPIFTDVPCSSGFAAWVNELFNRGITAGCGGGNYCPTDPVTRGQMAVFLTKTFGLVLYGP